MLIRHHLTDSVDPVDSRFYYLTKHFLFKDFLSLEEDDAPAEKRDRESDCLCQKSGPDGSNCICCLEFNISETFDLGPACVRMKYLSQADGIAMNLTLGKTLAKSSTIKIEKPEQPVCLSMLGGLAKMCAKFNGLAPSANGGLIGCLAMQPKLFGEVPINFDFPCFDLNNQEIRMIEAPKKPESDDKEEATDDEPAAGGSDETIGGFKVEDIINVVSNTADQGIKLITELFGITDEKPEAAADAESKSIPEIPKNISKGV